jgi:hypothetical protein
VQLSEYESYNIPFKYVVNFMNVGEHIYIPSINSFKKLHLWIRTESLDEKLYNDKTIQHIFQLTQKK